jgi:hypothetical protein
VDDGNDGSKKNQYSKVLDIIDKADEEVHPTRQKPVEGRMVEKTARGGQSLAKQ